MDMCRIVVLIWIIKDKETFWNLDCFTRYAISLRNISDFLFVTGVTRKTVIFCAGLTRLAWIFVLSQVGFCRCNLLFGQILFEEIMCMAAVLDNVTFLIFWDDMFSMETMVVLVFISWFGWLTWICWLVRLAWCTCSSLRISLLTSNRNVPSYFFF